MHLSEACVGRRLAVFGLLLTPATPAHAGAEIRTLTPVLTGHHVGGVTVDLVGNLYVADFGDVVLKVAPTGERSVLASHLYGASGNAVDKDGSLLQSNCYASTVVRIDRSGEVKPFAREGLKCPVGIAIGGETGETYIASCTNNQIVRVAADGKTSVFARSDLFKCPNGIVFGPNGDLYVVNYRDNRMLKVDPNGVVSTFAEVSMKGLGHLCLKDDHFYVTAFQSHEIYEVTLDGKAKRILGNGTRGSVDGIGEKARLSFPNGIACDPFQPRLYINESVNGSLTETPHRSIVRQIDLDPNPSSRR